MHKHSVTKETYLLQTADLRVAGFSAEEIGRRIGRSTKTVHQYIKQFDRRKARAAEGYSDKVPDWFDGLEWRVVHQLIHNPMNYGSRESCMVWAANDLTLIRGMAVSPNHIAEPNPYILERCRLNIKDLNILRQWLGVPDFVPPPKTVNPKRIKAAISLLQANGYTVTK